jgi:hypothetical protein
MTEQDAENYRRHIISADESYSREDFLWLEEKSDRELLDFIRQMGATTKRDSLVTLLDARSTNVMIRLTRWIIVLTWVLVAVGVIQVVDLFYRYFRR